CAFNPRCLLALSLCSARLLLAISSFTGMPGHPTGPDGSNQGAPGSINQLKRYMPVPGGEPDDLDRMEVEWNNRLTYPTGIFNPEWLRLAAAGDALVTRAVPAGIPLSRAALAASPLALTTTGFTALGPAPLRMTGCTLCFDY